MAGCLNLSKNYSSDIAARAELLGLSDPPEVSPVRVVTREEFLQVQQKCLAEEGFTTELDPDGDGLAVTLADGQGKAYLLADYVCQGRYPLHEVYTRDVTETQLRTYFEWNTGELATCMAGLGYAVPDPPSFEVFTATYEAGRGSGCRSTMCLMRCGWTPSLMSMNTARSSPPTRRSMATSADSAQQPALPRDRGGLGPAGGAELGQDVGHVHADRFSADEQLLADLSVRAPLGNESQHLLLARSQARRTVIHGAAAPGRGS